MTLRILTVFKLRVLLLLMHHPYWLDFVFCLLWSYLSLYQLSYLPVCPTAVGL